MIEQLPIADVRRVFASKIAMQRTRRNFLISFNWAVVRI